MNRADILHLPWRLAIRDATGATRTCRVIVGRDAIRKYHCAPSRDFSRRAIRHFRWAILLPWAISSFLYIAAFAAVLWLSDSWPPENPLTVYGLWIAIMAIYLTIGSAPTMVAYRRAHMAYFAKTGHCAWCLYDIGGIPADASGLTTCPECGGGWRMTNREGVDGGDSIASAGHEVAHRVG